MSSHDPFQDDPSEDEEDFNPAPADDSGDEIEAEVGPHGDGEDDSESRATSNGRAIKGRADDHDAEPEGDPDDGDKEEEQEEEEEEEEEDDEDEDIGTSRKRRRTGGNAFLDLEADVDDEDEGEDDEADGEEIRDFLDAHPDDPDEGHRFHDDRHHRELDRRRQLEAGVDAEQQAEVYKQRYGKRHRKRGMGEGDVLPRRLLLPSVDDPSIWAIKCKEGKEREVIFNIMKRVEEARGTPSKLHITSAFERGGPNSVMKGTIYVEAQRLNDVILALEGMLNVYVRSKAHLVDVKEMPDLLRIQKTDPLERGAWVRLRRPPKHNGDLAQVLDVTENGLEARVRFIPRIDWGTSSTSAFASFGKRKRPHFGAGPRPPQRLFSEAEAKKHDPRRLQPQGNSWIYNQEEFENGFQIKDIKIQLLQTQNVNPSLDEVTKFASNGEDGNENLDLGALAETLKAGSHLIIYVPGDTVEVFEGEQKGVWGKATHVTGDIVTLKVSEGGLTGKSIEVPTRWLRKKFNIGDHVKVVGGSKYRDEVGMVVKIQNDRVTLLTDTSSQEVTVFSKDLREASDMGGQGSLGQYSLLDLVQIDAVTVGCVVKVDRESLGVLDQNGDVRMLMPSQISNRLPKRKMAVAADRNGSEIKIDDVVKEYMGQHRQGKIIHIHRSFVFLHSNDVKENSGVFVVRSNNVMTVAAKNGRIAAGQAANAGPDLSAMNPALQRNMGNQPKAMAPPRTVGRDRSIGQTVHVRKGGYKGLLGIVKDATDTHVRLELHTKNKTVTLPKDHIIFKDKVTGERIDISRPRGPPQRGGPQAPLGDRGWQGGRTPGATRDSGRTPAWGSSATPWHNSGGRTPAWNRADGGRTPAWQDGSRTVNPHDGSRTVYGSGGRTPAWSVGGGKTPAHGDFGSGSKTPAYGGNDSWASGSKTPGYGVSAPTPGATGGDWGAPTPGALNAPTPGAYSAPTPAAVSAPTPGAWQSSSWGGADSAPTPAAGAPTPTGGMYYGAPTPAPYSAETPAASGPRYDD